MEVELDRISDLPNEVLDKILSYLPIMDGARTSVLSSKWRYKFAMLPCLVFHHLCSSDIVNHVLLSHSGPINKFQLSQGPKKIIDIDTWILFLSRHPIKELILKCSILKCYKMPSCVYSYQDLIHLNLSNCLIEPPSAFKGFRSLKSLHFEYVTLAQDVFEHLIVCCPLLERLSFKECRGFSQLKIDAPNLLFLHCAGMFKDLSIVNTLKLAVVSIDLLVPQEHCSSGNLLKFFDDLPQVQNLHIKWSCLNYLAGGALPEKLHKPFLHLKVLGISMFFDEVDDVSIALCLLRSSPALETLNIRAMGYQNQADVGAVNPWLYNNRSCSFNQLRHVNLHRITSVEAELEFIRFLLVSSPVLETLTVVPGEPDAAAENQDLVVLRNSFHVVKRLLQFRRASPNLEIMYLDP